MKKGENAKRQNIQKCNEDSGIGFLGIAAIAAGVAAGYFLYGKDGARNRKKVKGWMLKAKGEVLEKIEKMKDIDQADYEQVIDKVAEKYSKMKSLDKEEVMDMMNDMKKHWKNIEKKIEPQKKRAKRVIRSGAKVVKKKIAVSKKKKAIAKPVKRVARGKVAKGKKTDSKKKSANTKTKSPRKKTK